MHEAYAYGVIAPSRLIELQDGFPPEAGYGEITRIHPSLGGEAAAGAYVLSRLGVATKLSGTRLGNDPESQRVLELLTLSGVDCSAVATDSEDPVTELVFSGNGERTVFGSYGRMLANSDWIRPSRDDIESAEIVCLDPFFGEASVQAARWCREASVPFVTVDTPPDSEVARHAAAVIISEEFARRTFPKGDSDQLMAVYTGRCEGLVIVTRGSNPLHFARRGEAVRAFTPFTVETSDTTGAGDSFRAGLIFGMLRDYDDRRLIETASAVAAIVSQRVPGVLHGPTVAELQQFLGTTD